MGAVMFLGVIAWALYAASRNDAPQDEPEDELIDTARLIREIDALHSMAHQLADLDDMLIDLRLCRPGEVHRAFKMEWLGAAGKSHSVDFMSDGENAADEYLTELAYARRDELNAEICERIYDLYLRACAMAREDEYGHTP